MTFFHRAALTVAGAVLAATTTERAFADGLACTAAAEEGQRSRAAGKFRDARVQFTTCMAETCPGVVRRDCAQWGTEVLAMMPTVVVDARDAAGRDIGDVTVTIDGEIVATRLDGKALPIDPGPHTIVFERVGFEPVTERVIIKEGAKARVLNAAFLFATAPDPWTKGAPPDRPTDPSRHRRHTVYPWLVVALGGVGVASGVVLHLAAPALPAECASESKCGDFVFLNEAQHAQYAATLETASRRRTMRTIGTISILSGAGLIAGGLVWHFLEPTGATRAALVTPWATDSGAGLTAFGNF